MSTQPLTPKNLVVEVVSKPDNQQNPCICLNWHCLLTLFDVYEWTVSTVTLHDQKIASALTVFSHLMYSLCCWA